MKRKNNRKKISGGFSLPHLLGPLTTILLAKKITGNGMKICPRVHPKPVWCL